MELKLPLVLDGSTGTQIQKRGFDGESTAEEWCIKNPDAVMDFQQKYIESGSTIIYSPTFGANASTLESHNVYGAVEEFNIKLATISKKVAEGRAYVAGDISPCGRFLYPIGDATFEDIYNIYYEQASALEKAGVDLFVIETMVSLSDARAAILAVKDVSNKPIFVTFTCDETGRTMMGTDIVAALVICQSMGIDAFGLNCSSGPDTLIEQIKRLWAYAEVPLIAKPNAGLPQVVNGKTVYNCTADEFTAYVDEMAKYGVGLFGGCCGTTEDHIRALAQKVKNVEYIKPAAKNRDKLLCATGKNLFELTNDIQLSTVIECDENLQERIEESTDTVICISVDNDNDVQHFADCQFSVDRPLCIKSNNIISLEKAVRVFQGRALYEGNLTYNELVPIAKKYGLII